MLVEARAAPRLHTVEGLWRRSTRARPGSMTAFIRDEHLLPADEIDLVVTSPGWPPHQPLLAAAAAARTADLAEAAPPSRQPDADA